MSTHGEFYRNIVCTYVSHMFVMQRFCFKDWELDVNKVPSWVLFGLTTPAANHEFQDTVLGSVHGI